MTIALTDEISAISRLVAEKVGAQKYRIWFKNTTSLTLASDYLQIEVPNVFIANWIKSHFSSQINQAVRDVLGDSRKLVFKVDASISDGTRPATKPESMVKPELPSCISKPAPAKIQKQERPGRIPLKLSFDDFVVGSSNELAYNAARVVVKEKQSPFNPLFIHGGYGVGKTHLLQGICNEVCQSRPGTNWLYLSAEDFANQFVLALKTKKLEAFRRRMRQTDLLAIDDIHFLASKPSTQGEFFHTFNSIDLAGKQIVLVSDAHPKMIDQLSDKLVNRFVSGMVVKVDTPDLQMRLEICRRCALKMKKYVPENVIRYIAENIKSNVRELEGAMLKITAFSALQEDKINLHIAKEILAEHIVRTDPIVHIGDIETNVAAFFGISTAQIHSSKKDKTITLARHFSMYLARKHTSMSSPEVGKCLGNKNHATVLLACKKVEDQISRNLDLNWTCSTGNKISKARTVLAKLEEAIAN
ncbi:MAG TPA: chromosomal replication initiator protein DnaA [Sedimentisphaerales bacterium]|nr:chromosomal replication initiator protein DnaA [Sedimentisphaerales bacterium]